MADTQGISVRYDIKHRTITKRLAELAARGQRLRPVFMEIGERLVESTQDRFASKVTPKGRSWQAVSDKYADRKRNRKATKDPADARTNNPDDLNFLTGRMRDNLAYQASDSDLVVGSGEVYAPVRNKDREFLGLSESDRDAIRDLLQDHLDAP